MNEWPICTPSSSVVFAGQRTTRFCVANIIVFCFCFSFFSRSFVGSLFLYRSQSAVKRLLRVDLYNWGVEFCFNNLHVLLCFLTEFRFCDYIESSLRFFMQLSHFFANQCLQSSDSFVCLIQYGSATDFPIMLQIMYIFLKSCLIFDRSISNKKSVFKPQFIEHAAH